MTAQIKIGTVMPGASMVRPDIRSSHKVWRGFILTSEGKMQNVYFKFPNIRELVVEMTCALLGREVKLPIPEPYFINAKGSVAEELGLLPAQKNGVFGFAMNSIEATDFLHHARDTEEMMSILSKWKKIHQAIAFDEWIANKDRTPQNLLYAGIDDIYLIDHGEAIPEHSQPNESVGNFLLKILSEELGVIDKNQANQKLNSACYPFGGVDIKRIGDGLKENSLVDAQQAEMLINFLRTRLGHLRELFEKDLGIKNQMTLKFH